MKIGNGIGILFILMIIALFVGPVAAAEDPSLTDDATQDHNLGVKYLGTGEYANASQAFDMALRANTTLIGKSDTLQYVYEDKAYTLIQIKEYYAAMQTAQEGATLFPTDKKLWNNEGFAFYNLGQYQDALNSYNQAIKLDENYTTALINKGGTLYKLEKYQDAVDAYTKALETDPGNSDATAGLEHAQQSAAQALPVSPVLIVLIVIVIIAAAGAIWYVKSRKPVEKKSSVKKSKPKKK